MKAAERIRALQDDILQKSKKADEIIKHIEERVKREPKLRSITWTTRNLIMPEDKEALESEGFNVKHISDWRDGDFLEISW